MKIYFQTTFSHSTKVVGESSYQDNIQTVIGFSDEGQQQVREDGFDADLILEDDNPFDRGNAVRVDINGYTVGYLSRDDAADYRRSLAQLGAANAIGNCSAVIAGKWNQEVEALIFGVSLDLTPKRLTVRKKVQTSPAVASKPKAKESVPQPTQTTTAKSKIPFIPMKGKGCLYILFILPILVIINFYILLFAGLWYGGQSLWKIATATQTSRRISAVVASLTLVCGTIYSAASNLSSENASATPTLDVAAIQNTAMAEAWLSYTKTAQASITDTPLATVTLPSTETSVPTATLVPPTATLITFPTSTPFFLNLPGNQPTSAPAGGTCPCSGDTLNCGDFGSWSSAQSCYTYCVSQGAGDIHGLDGNNDGSACDSLK